MKRFLFSLAFAVSALCLAHPAMAQVPPGPVSITGTITSGAGGTGQVTFPTQFPNPGGLCSISIQGTYVATLVFEFTNDGTNFAPTALSSYSQVGPAVTVTSVAAQGYAPCGANNFRVRATAYTSGTATVTLTQIPGITPYLPVLGSNTGANSQSVVIASDQLPNISITPLFIGSFATTTLVQQIAAPGASKNVYIILLSASNTTATGGTVTVVQGTGSNCGTSTVTLYVVQQSAIASGAPNASISNGGQIVIKTTVANSAVCIQVSSASMSDNIMIDYFTF